MQTFLFTGQRSFGNRGCEAIVRSTVGLLRQASPSAKFLVPSEDICKDAAHWPDAEDSGVQFVRAYNPFFNRPWVHTQRLPVHVLKRAGWPFPFPKWLVDQVRGVDSVISIGGDNYSLDYRLPSLLMGLDGLAMRLGKPVFIWGASVGPFESEPHFVPAIRSHLAKMRRIWVRETQSLRYLQSVLGLTNVALMADPAFTLEKKPVTGGATGTLDASRGVLGLNFSPLMERYKGSREDFISCIVDFVRYCVDEKGLSVLLVPHVIPLDGSLDNNDHVYLQQVLARCDDLKGRVALAEPALTAGQLKEVISGLRYFIGARTHATIAALSSKVPTLSIGYSVKALGINRDLFGPTPPVLPVQEVSSETLARGLNFLIDSEESLKRQLSDCVPAFQQRARDAATQVVADVLAARAIKVAEAASTPLLSA